jgi:hypothetical protein
VFPVIWSACWSSPCIHGAQRKNNRKSLDLIGARPIARA